MRYILIATDLGACAGRTMYWDEETGWRYNRGFATRMTKAKAVRAQAALADDTTVQDIGIVPE